MSLGAIFDKGKTRSIKEVMPNEFTKVIEQMNCPVHIFNSDKDLVGLSLRIAKEGFKRLRA